MTIHIRLTSLPLKQISGQQQYCNIQISPTVGRIKETSYWPCLHSPSVHLSLFVLCSFLFYPCPSTSIAHCTLAPCPLLCRRIDWQCGFSWSVWGTDTSEFGLLILLSYPNEPRLSVSNTRVARMTGRKKNYHLTSTYMSVRVSWMPFLKAINRSACACVCTGVSVSVMQVLTRVMMEMLEDS